jgi:major membrane immunogen (membrane-anchored lipoprotein)
MARYGIGVLLIVVVVATAVLAGACGSQSGGTQQVGKMQRVSKSVDPKNADSARAQLKMGAGELNLTGGADQLMEADFSYNVSDWKPKVSYDVSGKKGKLVVKQGSAEGGNLSGGARNKWDISLNDELPTDLAVQLGAGESVLDLDSLTLTGVDLQMGAGKTTVDLTGDYAQDFDATIEGGVGKATVLLPSKIGVKAKAEGGLGKISTKGLKKVGDSYVNEAYGESDTNLSVDVKGGVGAINLKVV